MNKLKPTLNKLFLSYSFSFFSRFQLIAKKHLFEKNKNNPYQNQSLEMPRGEATQSVIVYKHALDFQEIIIKSRMKTNWEENINTCSPAKRALPKKF